MLEAHAVGRLCNWKALAPADMQGKVHLEGLQVGVEVFLPRVFRASQWDSLPSLPHPVADACLVHCTLLSTCLFTRLDSLALSQ